MCSTLKRSATLAVRCAQCDARMEAELARVQGLTDVELGRLRQYAEAESELNAAKIELLEKRLTWYRDPLFVVPVAVLVTAAALLGARKLIVETQ